MRLVVFGLSITSSWGNGHATTYRGLLKALARRGVSTLFVEKTMPWYASNRDLWSCDYARVVLYEGLDELRALARSEAALADVALVGSYFPDAELLTDLLAGMPALKTVFYDIDTPVTLAALANTGDAGYLRSDQVALFDAVLSFTGGRALEELKGRWGARRAVALYCGLDPEVHARAATDERFRCRLGYMGTYSPDRHAAWERLFLRSAARFPAERFVMAGPQYPAREMPDNVVHYNHVPPSDHPAFYSSSDLILNITRAPMVAYGFCPSVRLFEAAGCASCVVSDRWEGLGEIFEIGRELLVAGDEIEMADLLSRVGPEEFARIGERARERALRDHTYDHRAEQFLELIESL